MQPVPDKHLLLLGGGHAHLSLLQRLRREPPKGWRVTLVSPHARQIYSGMLPGWVAGHYALDDCVISLTGLCERARIAFAQTRATGLDLANNAVLCADGERRRFDLVSIDTGPEPALAKLPGAAEHALPVRPIEGFIAGWPSLMRRWREPKEAFEVAIVGSGAAAVELACAIQFRAGREGVAGVRVHLVGRDTEPLAGAAGNVVHRVTRLLRERGIRWRGHSTAVQLLPGAIRFEQGANLPFDACLVATGAAPPHWPRAAGLSTDDAGFICVDRTLRSSSHPCVFAAGDVAAYADARPKSGVFAVRAGAALAHNILAACNGEALADWHPQPRALYLVSTGDRRAIASWGAWSASGRWVWAWKDWIDRRFVQRYRD
jgi:pyridine nucleotide-disulfide oxidoreductase family protein